MDQNNIPACALHRNIATCIVRLKMEVTTRGCDACPPSGCTEVVHRPSLCEQCNRTRLISKYSDCDSGVVDKYRPYRSSAARSRYVNVCAAVCLLLLFGSLSPRSSAAPHRRIMEKRAAGENKLWGNPCDYDDSTNGKKYYTANDVKAVAAKLVAQAKNAYTITAQYKDTFALKLHSYSNFDDLLVPWKPYEWLRKFDWLPEEALPKEKVLYTPMTEQYMNQLMEKIDSTLPGMYKGLKMIVAGLHAFSEDGLNGDIVDEENLKESINQTMHGVRAVLCYFSDIMAARNLTIMPLPDSEVPDFKTDDRLTNGLLLYRDTLNYLEYLSQVFQKLHETKF